MTTPRTSGDSVLSLAFSTCPTLCDEAEAADVPRTELQSDTTTAGLAAVSGASLADQAQAHDVAHRMNDRHPTRAHESDTTRDVCSTCTRVVCILGPRRAAQRRASSSLRASLRWTKTKTSSSSEWVDYGAKLRLPRTDTMRADQQALLKTLKEGIPGRPFSSTIGSAVTEAQQTARRLCSNGRSSADSAQILAQLATQFHSPRLTRAHETLLQIPIRACACSTGRPADRERLQQEAEASDNLSSALGSALVPLFVSVAVRDLLDSATHSATANVSTSVEDASSESNTAPRLECKFLPVQTHEQYQARAKQEFNWLCFDALHPQLRVLNEDAADLVQRIRARTHQGTSMPETSQHSFRGMLDKLRGKGKQDGSGCTCGRRGS